MPTTTQTQEVDIFKSPAYGELVKMPTILKENQLSAGNALAATDKRLAAIDQSKFLVGDITQIEADIAGVAKLRSTLDTTFKKLEGKRKPFTGFFDSVRALFTAEEKTITACIARCKAVQDAWEKAKAQRAAEQRRREEDEIRLKQAIVDVRATIKAGIERQYASALLAATQKMNAMYHGQAVDKLEAYAERLAKAVPDFAKLEFSRRVAVYNQALTEIEIQEIEVARAKELEPTLAADYCAKMCAERDRLVALTPSKLKALRENAEKEAARVEAEATERSRQAEQAQREADQRAQAQAEADKLNTVFEVAATAELAPERSKWTIIKKVYRPTTHADWASILQLYVKRDFPALTLADVEKKFGFALTAANKRLNDGEVLEGLKQEEDYSTRTNSRK